jgi:hypothetical protein
MTEPLSLRMRELNALIAKESRKLQPKLVRPHLPRMQLVTVTPLRPLCPVCEGPRKYWGHESCSHKCAKRMWERKHPRRKVA